MGTGRWKSIRQVSCDGANSDSCLSGFPIMCNNMADSSSNSVVEGGDQNILLIHEKNI